MKPWSYYSILVQEDQEIKKTVTNRNHTASCMVYNDFRFFVCLVFFLVSKLLLWRKENTMKSNLISKCLTFYVLPETHPAEAVPFNVVDGVWFSSGEKKKRRGWGEKAANTTLSIVWWYSLKVFYLVWSSVSWCINASTTGWYYHRFSCNLADFFCTYRFRFCFIYFFSWSTRRLRKLPRWH